MSDIASDLIALLPGPWGKVIVACKLYFQFAAAASQETGKRAERLEGEYRAKGMSEKEAKVWALWELGLLDADPQTILRMM
jgi:hypothetical protein